MMFLFVLNQELGEEVTEDMHLLSPDDVASDDVVMSDDAIRTDDLCEEKDQSETETEGCK